MNRIDRLFGILVLLQSKKFVPAEKISEKFRISIRTVYRDVKALSESGIPISFEQYRGYFIVQGYFLPPVSFTMEEASAFLLMETMLPGFADKSIQKNFSAGLNKVKAVMRSQEKDQLENLTENIKMQVPERLYSDLEYMSALQTAISEKSIIEIQYSNNKEEISSRKLEPLGLIFYAFSWHLIGWCHLRLDYRDFKISNIKKLHNTGIGFTKSHHITMDEYMKLLPVKY